MTGEERTDEINRLKDRIRTLQSSLNELVRNCKHELGPYEEDSPAHCKICNSDLGGWMCPSSPDGVCHYHSYAGLCDSNLIEEGIRVPEDHDPKRENSDWCIWCGDPDERK